MRFFQVQILLLSCVLDAFQADSESELKLFRGGTCIWTQTSSLPPSPRLCLPLQVIGNHFGHLNTDECSNLTFDVCLDMVKIKLTGIGWEARQISKGVCKAALFYVEQTVTVHIVLCCVRARMFLLVCCLFAFNTFCVLCTVKTNEQKRWRTKTKQRNWRVSLAVSLYQLWSELIIAIKLFSKYV